MRTKLIIVCLLFACYSLRAQVSDQTMKQIQLLQNEKNSRTPLQQKIDCHLLQALKESRGEKMTEGVDLQPANVKADFSGNLKVDINAEITNAFLAKLTALGAQIIFSSAKYHTVRALINLTMVEKIAAYPNVKFIAPASVMHTVDVLENKKETQEKNIKIIGDQIHAFLPNPPIGSVTSEGDATHRAADARAAFGYLGAGVKIGVLSDSYNADKLAKNDVTSGDLPGATNPDGYKTPVKVLADVSGADEGRAMLQIIHDIAPAAQLYFATANYSDATFATNIVALRDSGCNIIVDDAYYEDEPAFQDGIIAQAVNTVTASGVLYFSSAGNEGSLVKGTSGVFEGDFNDSGSVAFPGSGKAGTIHNFGTVVSPLKGDSIITQGTYDNYNLTWSDPYGASANDYDLFVINSSGNITASSTNIQSGTQDPYEILGYAFSPGDRLVVFKTTGAAVRAFRLNTIGGKLKFATSGQTWGHDCAANAFDIAATPAYTPVAAGYPSGPYPNAFNTSNVVEPYTSDGPRKIFLNPDGSAISSGRLTFASGGGTLRNKPDFTAADGVSTTLSEFNPFFGTSAAAPHAAAIAALMLSADPTLTYSYVYKYMNAEALDIESPGYDNVSGRGILQAYQLMQLVIQLRKCNAFYDGKPHSSFATAVSIPLNTDVEGKISSATDTDFYSFSIKPKKTATINLTNLTQDYDIYLYKSTQAAFGSSKKTGTTSEALTKTFPVGTYYVKVIAKKQAFDGNNCYTLNVTTTSALITETETEKTQSEANTINIFPNPVHSTLNISNEKMIAGCVIKITDAYGTVVIKKQAAAAIQQIDVSKLAAGIYIVSIINKDGSVVTSKFVKQ